MVAGTAATSRSGPAAGSPAVQAGGIPNPLATELRWCRYRLVAAVTGGSGTAAGSPAGRAGGIPAPVGTAGTSAVLMALMAAVTAMADSSVAVEADGTRADRAGPADKRLGTPAG